MLRFSHRLLAGVIAVAVSGAAWATSPNGILSPTIQQAQAAIVSEQDSRFKVVVKQADPQTPNEVKEAGNVLQKYENALKGIKVKDLACKPSGAMENCLVTLTGSDGTQSVGNVLFVHDHATWAVLYPDDGTAE